MERRPRTFKPLSVPKSLQKDLPFADRPKSGGGKKRDPVAESRVAVIRDPKEKKVAQMMQMIKELHAHKLKQRRLEMRQRAAKHQKDQAVIEGKRQQKQKETRKNAFRSMGKKDASSRAKE